MKTTRLYWLDDHCLQADAHVIEASGSGVVLDQTCFYPGGGGQPPDEGWIDFPNGETRTATASVADGMFWHVLDAAPPANCIGSHVRLRINEERRIALARYHTVLHVLNTIALRDYNGWITGVQISVDYSRIDFRLEGFSKEMCADLERKVNEVLAAGHTLKAYYLPEDEFHNRPDLLRTLEVRPPVIDGRVRVVEIEGFDAQACGGTHVDNTRDLGTFTIFRTENKGKINKRLYARLTPNGQ